MLKIALAVTQQLKKEIDVRFAQPQEGRKETKMHHTQSKSAKIARHVWRPASSLLIKSTSLCPGTFSAQDESEKIGTLIGENPKGCPKSFFSLFGFKLTSPFGG